MDQKEYERLQALIGQWQKRVWGTQAALTPPQEIQEAMGAVLQYQLDYSPKPELDTPVIHYCAQCGRDMGFEWILGPVCGRCCRENHRRVMGGG